jgi:hypothetical protein
MPVLQRERIMAELWRRLSTVAGVAWTARNPSSPPGVENLPAVQIFEMDDEVVERTRRGGGEYPAYKRLLKVVIEAFISGSSEGAASSELFDFLGKLKTAMYQGGPSLGGLCELTESSGSRMLRPPAGNNVIGVGIELEIAYVENIAALFT